jgi:hypothetical protein
MRDTIAAFDSTGIKTDELIAATISLSEVDQALAGNRPSAATSAPKIHVDPRIS